MSRDFSPQDLDDFRHQPQRIPARTAEADARMPRQPGGAGADPDRERLPLDSRESHPIQVPLRGSRGVFYDRDRGYRLRGSELDTLTELGKFRVIAVKDLTDHAYQGDREQMERDIKNLLWQGLIEQGTFEGPEAAPRQLVTLTKTGHKFVRTNHLVSQGQAAYHGFVKPKEANHDADLYRVYQKEAARIREQGGRNLRVILDFELKKKLNRDLASFGPEHKHTIAERHGLQVVRGKIPVPDLRIEYETREGEWGRVDLELATEHYRPRQLAEKVHAGFSLYVPRDEAARLRRVLDQRELTAEILSL